MKTLEIFFSNQLEILYERLKRKLFEIPSPFMRRIVVVYGPAMKTWVMWRMAQDPELNLFFGIEFLYLNQAFERLSKLASSEKEPYFPTAIDLSFAIENELRAAISHFKTYLAEEKQEWEPLIHYLKLDPYQEGRIHFTQKMERRLIGLSQELARLFLEYGKNAPDMLLKWKNHCEGGWQGAVWRKLYGGLNWSYPANPLMAIKKPADFFSLHFFSISYMTTTEFSFLNEFSKHIPVNYYLLSPCAVFWSDIRSDREASYLQSFWKKKLGVHSPKVEQLEEFLSDRNPLLANYGRPGREMAQQIEESQAFCRAQYLLNFPVEMIGEDTLEGLEVVNSEASPTLLNALQADLLLMRNPKELPICNLEDDPGSIQLHITPNKRREVEILYHNLLGLMSKDSSIHFEDIIVMSPDIGEYAASIQSVFGRDESLIHFQILDLGFQSYNEIAQGFLQLLELSEGCWSTTQLLQFFVHPAFQRRHQFSMADYQTVKKWIEQAGIRWGEDREHRNELLKRRHCLKGSVEEKSFGTWEFGLTRLLLGLTNAMDESLGKTSELTPCAMIDLSQTELLNKWIRLLHSLRDDLAPLHDQSRMSIDDWVRYLKCLLENYFLPDFDNPHSEEKYDDLKEVFEVLGSSSRFLKDALYSFASIKSNLLKLLNQSPIHYQENNHQSVRFCSLLPLRSIPAKVVAMMGMDEEAFPRQATLSSLNLMAGEKNNRSPAATDFDRYLFLEALHAARGHLLLSYRGYAEKDGKEVEPSLVVTELFSYLDEFYQINGKSVSASLIFKHPFDAFDERYFLKEKGLLNFSKLDFLAAKSHCRRDKLSPYSFLDHFRLHSTDLNHHFRSVEDSIADSLGAQCQISLKQLSAVAKHPIKFHLNHVMEIYLDQDEEAGEESEESLSLKPLEIYAYKEKALREPADQIIALAEREGRLPPGLFKINAANKIKEEAEKIQEKLLQGSEEPAEVFYIEFVKGISEPILIKAGHWLVPAVTLAFGNACQVSIVGKISHSTSKGFFIFGSSSLTDVWKSWPQFLLYCTLVKRFPRIFEPQLISAKAVRPKRAFFDDPEKYLKQFVCYYSLCLKNFSPLLPDWIGFIFNEDQKGLESKMKAIFEDSFAAFQDPYLRWVFNKNHLPSAQEIIHFWKPQADWLMEDLMRSWYSYKEKGSDEAV